MTAICFSLIPLYWGKKKLSITIEVVGIMFALSVATSRLFEGMHYPTDIITGMLLTYLAFFISRQKLFETQNLNNQSQKLYNVEDKHEAKYEI
jgi:membrane-associated phospholipid phosphatase